MERFVKGDVVILPFPYIDLSSVKKRPALVIAVLKGNNIILAQITTNQKDDEDLVNLNKNDFASGFLKCDSFIIPSTIFTTDSFRIEYKIGRLKQEKMKEVQNKLCEIFTRN